MDIIQQLSVELNQDKSKISSTVKLIDEGNTIPFIARYRKEVTGGLDDIVLRNLSERLIYLRNLAQKKEDVTRIITDQGKMTDELEKAVCSALTLQEVEDIYRPYRPKRRTKATIAKEKGLLPLSQLLFDQDLYEGDVSIIAASYIDEEKGVNSVDEALAGAMDIIAEIISDNAEFRKEIRERTLSTGIVVSKAIKDIDCVYSQYYNYTEPINKIANHRILALDRGEREAFLNVKIDIDAEFLKLMLYNKLLKEPTSITLEYVKLAAGDSYDRLIKPSIEREVRNILTERAQDKAIELFAKNLHQLLLQPPIKDKTVLALDPGFRTGCKMAVVDTTGKVLDTGIVYCTLEHHDKEKSKLTVINAINKYNVDIIAIGNGTASKETEIFTSDLIKGLTREVKYLIVSEAGASVYSASQLASEEFPQYDVSLRSAVSIARRVEDPLAELVKIDPKAIGVGQYQHDMNEKHLDNALGGVVEGCVNNVGIDINTASPSLLSYVAGINAGIAKNIVTYREEVGKFTSRNQLKKVKKLGEKSYEQCAGFLRISDGLNILDNTAVHPESYELAKEILNACGYSLDDVRHGCIKELKLRASKIDLKKIAEKYGVGLPTVNDIVEELLKPGRDPRDELVRPMLLTDIMSIESLSPGIVLKGTVRNITDFGAFVDIGVHQDGLVHISQICSKFISHPMEILSVGDIVSVKIVDIDVKKGRISLSMRDIDRGLCKVDNK